MTIFAVDADVAVGFSFNNLKDNYCLSNVNSYADCERKANLIENSDLCYLDY